MLERLEQHVQWIRENDLPNVDYEDKLRKPKNHKCNFGNQKVGFY